MFLAITFVLGVISPILGNSVVGNCPPDELVMYKVTLSTMWDKRDFPKQYPDRRPPAQWSKLMGMSHDRQLELYEPGEVASQALKEFAETGRSERLDLLTQGGPGVLDAFRTAPVTQGVWEAASHFFVDGNHSRVSLVSKIVPSPDWFIGVNGYDLCAGGHWVDTVNIQLEPLDAGTDEGLTFTSPNWPSDPQERIHTITAQYPDHPVGSFYYPTLDHLPPIARVTFAKEKEYGLRSHFDAADASVNDIFSLDDISIKKLGEDCEEKAKVPYVTGKEMEVKRAQLEVSETHKTASSSNLNPWMPHHRHHSSKHHAEPTLVEGITEPGIHHMSNDVMPVADIAYGRSSLVASEDDFIMQNRKKIPTGDAMAVIDDIVKNFQKDRKRKMKKKRREEKRKRRIEMKNIRPPRDCRVSEWTEWSSCTKTCGIGEQLRKRKILKHARRGGKVCPSLQETTWCGSARDCNRPYFNWS